MRRLAVALGCAAASLVALGGVAAADDPTASWTDPAPQVQAGSSAPVGYVVREQPLAGVADHSAGIDNVAFQLVEDGADEPTDPCSAARSARPMLFSGGGAAHVAFSFDVRFPCNRRYVVRATVNPRRTLTHGPSNAVALNLDLLVAIPPPDLGDLQAEVDDSGPAGAVRLDWSAVAPAPADLKGYEVRRAAGGGEARAIGVVDPSATTYTDSAVLPGAAYRYEVVAVRPGPTGGTAVYSATPAIADIDVPGSPPTSGATPSGGSRSPTTTAKGASRPATTRRGQSTAVTVTAPSRPVPTTSDTGFQELLPFRVPPTTGLAGGAVIRLEGDGGDADKQTLALIAGGLATLVSAGLVRYVVAASKEVM